MGFPAVVVAGAELLAVSVGPGVELGAIARDVQASVVVQVDELQVDGARDEAGVEDSCRPSRHRVESRYLNK